MQNKTVKISTVLYALASVFLLFVVLAGFLIYGFGSDDQIAQKIANFFPYPAAVVKNTNLVSISDLEENVRAARKFYENQDFSQTGFRVDFSTADGEKRLMIKKKAVLNKMIENRVLEIMANERNIKITAEMADQAVAREISQYGNQAQAEENLKRLYGWSIEQFKERIVKPELYKEALEENLKKSDPQTALARKKIEQALTDLQTGKDFGATAALYSEGESAKSGGELGWFSADQMIPQIATAAFVLKKGERSEIIESSLGFHIVEVLDKKSEADGDMVKIRQILARTQNFPDWLLAQEKKIKIYIPLKDFYWDKNEQAVKFNDPDLIEFEKNLDKNSPGDISVLF
jgi:parvulin-like peptidyl-prolyl isomerase